MSDMNNNEFQVYDLSNASHISLTSTGFKIEWSSYVCKITGASIVFIGDNTKFANKNLLNTLTLVLFRKPIGRVQEKPR